MFRVLSIIIILFSTTTISSQTINNGPKKLLGLVNKESLTQPPFNYWFAKNHTSYQLNKIDVEKLKTALSEYEIIVFLGTWCGDSRREVPRFYKILEAANFPEKQLKVIAVDNHPKRYKKSPGGEEKGLNIRRVPTFIFYKGGKEVNRIIEYPKESLEKDILKIITGDNYKS